MRGMRVFGAAAAAAVLLGAAGCSSATPAPVVAASSPVATTVTASAPPSSAPVAPAAASSSSVAPSASSSVPPALTPEQASALETDLTTTGAEKFVRAYIGVENRMRLTGDSTQFRAWSLPDCNWCNGIANDADDEYARGWYYRGDFLFVEGVSAPPVEYDGQVGVTFNFNETAFDSVHGDGIIRHFPMTPVEHDVITLAPISGAWRVTSLGAVPSVK